ncbi:hypothetical protein Pcac1_g2302 [Phytophthora cactorum]|nr:hypothetical protein Pcac1_g2302 [Phytophthora cactorum]
MENVEAVANNKPAPVQAVVIEECGEVDEEKENDKVQTGITAFAPYPLQRIAVISCEADKLKNSLENRKSKKQWCTGDLEESNFLTSTNKIPNATIADYVSVFHGALDYLMGAANDLDDSDKGSSGSEDNENSDEEEDEKNEEDDDNSDGESDEEDQGEDADQDTKDDQISSKVDPNKIRRQLVVLEDGAPTTRSRKLESFH